MIRSKFLILIFFFLPVLVFAQEPVQLKAGGSTIIRHAKIFPAELQEWLNYPSSEIYLTGQVDGNTFLTPTEGVVVLQTKDTAEAVISYYETVFKKNKWSVIQTNRNDHKTLIMAESTYKRLVTLIITDNQSVIIKLYYKRSGNE
jgi:hypothetical protein